MTAYIMEVVERAKPYAEAIKGLLLMASKRDALWQANVELALNGQPSKEIRRLVPIDELRGSGAFFTGVDLAQLAFHNFSENSGTKSVFFDPTVGVGDLLLHASDYLPLKENFVATLKYWEKRLLGLDIHPTFVEIAKNRLVLKILSRGKYTLPSGFDYLQAFPNIQVGSALAYSPFYKSATHVLLNPPYYPKSIAHDSILGSGKVNASALFLKHAIQNVSTETIVLAILPDVLRSGTRYSKLRSFVDEHTEVNRIHLYGTFDSRTDVDVFILSLKKNSTLNKRTNWNQTKSASTTVGDFFDVSIGSVVDFRDPRMGSWKKYLVSKDIGNQHKLSSILRNRRHISSHLTAPFVVVKRTSRYGDRKRASAALVQAKGSIVVDNHLIVLVPKDGKVATCRKLLDVLDHTATSSWLNKRIRCRHLSVGAVKEIPWRESP